MNPPLQTAAQLLHALEQRRQRALLPTRIAPFDRLHGGGLVRGSLVELAGTRSSGRLAIAFAALAAATRAGEATAFVDFGDHLDPAAAQAAGVDLRRLLWVRPRTVKEAVLAAETVLSAGFALVVLDLGVRPVETHRIPPSVWVRLERSAEAHHAILVLIAPSPIRSPVADAVVTVDGARPVWRGAGAAPRLFSGIASRLSVDRRKGERTHAAGGLTLGVREGIDLQEGA